MQCISGPPEDSSVGPTVAISGSGPPEIPPVGQRWPTIVMTTVAQQWPTVRPLSEIVTVGPTLAHQCTGILTFVLLTEILILKYKTT